MTIYEALLSEDISYRDLFNGLKKADYGDWDSVNSLDDIRNYLLGKAREGVPVKHLLEALESDQSAYGDWWFRLADSEELPSPINSKEDLYEALALDEVDLAAEIEFGKSC